MLRGARFLRSGAVVAALALGSGCSSDDGATDASGVTAPGDTLAPPATLDTPALPVGTDTPGTEVAADEQDVAEIPVALAVALRSYGDGWTSLAFTRGGDAEWPDLVEVGIDRTHATGIATTVVDGVTVTVISDVADSDVATTALVDAGATPIDVGGTTVYLPPASRRTPLGAALSGFDVVGTAYGLFVGASGDADADADAVAALASRPLAAWEESAVLSATALAPLFGADRIVASTGGLEPTDAYRVAHPGASASATEAWADEAATLRPPASPRLSAAGQFGIDPATALGRAVTLYQSPEDATAAAAWLDDIWSSAASYDGTTTWEDTFGNASVSTDGTVLTLEVHPSGDGWLAAPLPLAWSAADAADAADAAAGTVSPAD